MTKKTFPIIQTVPIGSLALDDAGAFKIGPFGSALKKAELVSRGIPVAGIENILPNCFVRDFHKFITPQKFAELADYEIRPGDVIVTTMGTIGRAAVAPESLGRAIFDSHLFRMRLDTTRANPDYVCYAINSNRVVAQLAHKAHGSIMEGLNTSILKECTIPLPGLPEQERITTLLKRSEHYRVAIEETLRQTNHLLQTLIDETFPVKT